MILYGVENQKVEIRLHNYQFPDSTDKDYDGNWLEIFLIVQSKLGNWQSIDPSLLTWEVQEIIDWFKDLSLDKEPKYKDLDFIEPNLSIKLMNEVKSQTKRIRVVFDLESRPKSANDEIEYFVEINLTNQELDKAAKDFEVDLSKFPERK